MLYKIAHFVRDKIPFLWDLVDILNSLLFSCRYKKRLSKIMEELPISELGLDEYDIVPLKCVNVQDLVSFFARQPEEAFEYFRPHNFNAKCLQKLQRNKSFLAYILKEGENIAGYCFIRAFFHGKGFRGRMVDINYRGRGLGTKMNKLLNEIGFGTGLRLFETVSRDNVASYRSALSASNVKVVRELPHNELYLEIING